MSPHDGAMARTAVHGAFVGALVTSLLGQAWPMIVVILAGLVYGLACWGRGRPYRRSSHLRLLLGCLVAAIAAAAAYPLGRIPIGIGFTVAAMTLLVFLVRYRSRPHRHDRTHRGVNRPGRTGPRPARPCGCSAAGPLLPPGVARR